MIMPNVLKGEPSPVTPSFHSLLTPIRTLFNLSPPFLLLFASFPSFTVSFSSVQKAIS